MEPALETTSGNFKNSQDYALTAYVKTAEWMYLLEQSVGMEKVDSAFKNYFNLWKFKHPQPSDMKVAFEQSLNGSLTTFFDLINKKEALQNRIILKVRKARTMEFLKACESRSF